MSQIEFKQTLKLAKNILVITGAGISADSGIPTFRGSRALRWRNYESCNLATLPAFLENPSLVWEFYHFRREIFLKANPNAAHAALSKFEMKCKKENKQFTLITQNVDGLHRRAGSENIISIHGEIFETKCMKCKNVKENFISPICEGLRDKGDPNSTENSSIPEESLPTCEFCRGLLRPNVVWFGENLHPDTLEKSYDAIKNCDLCVVIGTSGIVQPVASFPYQVINRGVPVAEFNVESTDISGQVQYFIRGPASSTLPPLLE